MVPECSEVVPWVKFLLFLRIVGSRGLKGKSPGQVQGACSHSERVKMHTAIYKRVQGEGLPFGPHKPLFRKLAI